MFVKGVVMMCSHACLREYSECLLNTSAKSVDELVEPWNVDFVSRPKSVFCMLVVFACMCPCVCVCVCVCMCVFFCARVTRLPFDYKNCSCTSIQYLLISLEWCAAKKKSRHFKNSMFGSDFFICNAQQSQIIIRHRSDWKLKVSFDENMVCLLLWLRFLWRLTQSNSVKGGLWLPFTESHFISALFKVVSFLSRYT